MTDLRKAAEMALEALEQTPTANKLFDSESYEKQKDAIDALRQALAQQERLNEITRQFVGVNEDGSERWVETEYRTVIRSEWVGLTDEEIEECKIDGGLPHTVNWRLSAKVMQAKLKEKNT